MGFQQPDGDDEGEHLGHHRRRPGPGLHPDDPGRDPGHADRDDDLDHDDRYRARPLVGVPVRQVDQVRHDHHEQPSRLEPLRRRPEQQQIRSAIG